MHMTKEVLIILERLPQNTTDTMLNETSKTDNDYACARCENSFTTKNHLREHLRHTHQIYEDNHAKTNSYECPQCGKVFPRISPFNVHWLYHQPPKLICTECPRKFRLPHALRKHLRQQHNKIVKQQMFQCSICGKKCNTSAQLNCHSAYHKSPQFSCSDCGRQFFLWRDLQSHISGTHMKSVPINKGVKKANKGNPDSFTCPVCQKQFAHPRSLSIHSAWHKPSRFKCEMCEAQFFRQCHLDKHQVSVHNIEVKKRTKCDICGKEFGSAPGLLFHKKFHSSPTLSCNICELTFYTEGSLNVHTKACHSSRWPMPTQLSNKHPFVCAVCCRPFRCKGALKVHLCIHYRHNRNFQCHICQRIFSVNYYLTHHLRRTHKQ